MSPRRKQVIGGQVAAVAALVLVVYLTLLQPGDVGPLRGIEAPEGRPAPTVQHHNQGDDHGGRKSKKNDRGPATGEGGAAPVGEVLVAGPPDAGGLAAPPAVQVASHPTPSGDQYGDAVDALLDKVGAGGVPHD